MQNPRTFKGTEQPNFLHLRSTFAESYERIIALKADQPFVVYYGTGTQRTERTFKSFDKDVQRVRGLIGVPTDTASVLVVIDSNSLEHMVFATAALLNGFSLCPMNPEEGAERLAGKILQLAEPCAVWVGRDVSEQIALSTSANRMTLPQDDCRVSETRGFDRDRAMVLVFTSGTTGFSRIVEQSEESILSNVDALIGRHEMERGEPCIGTSLPLFHVNALEFSFFSTLLSGSRLVLFRSFNLGQVLGAVASERITVLSLIPQMVNILCGRKKEVLASEISSLRYVKTAAAPLSAATAKNFIDAFPFRLVQGYGLSEAVNFSALMPIDLSHADYVRWMTSYDRPSIGTEIEGNEMLIVNSDGALAEPGSTGEVCVRGFNVMNGYRGDQGKECFRGGHLHTGDLGFFETADDGRKFFFINGRIKDVIKRYGQTISLVEIDDALGTWSQQCMDAIAVPFENDIAEEEVGVMLSSPTYDSRALKSLKVHLENSLPPILRPAVLAWTNAPLRTPSGKPIRWKFVGHFADSRARIFTPSIAIQEQGL